jgi:hypothetical protein
MHARYRNLFPMQVDANTIYYPIKPFIGSTFRFIKSCLMMFTIAALYNTVQADPHFLTIDSNHADGMEKCVSPLDDVKSHILWGGTIHAASKSTNVSEALPSSRYRIIFIQVTQSLANETLP